MTFVWKYLRLKKFSILHGFTLIELLVAISIVAILSTIGIVVFSNATETARDTTRKNALKQIQIALELYYEETGKYPTPPSSSSSSDECTKIEKGTLGEKLDKYLKNPPKDPKQSEDPEYKYCYKLESNGEYLLSAKLENCEESNVNKEACTYVISSDESFIAQAPIIPTPKTFIPINIPNPISNPFNRPAPITPITEFQDPGTLPASSVSGSGDCAWTGMMNVTAYAFSDANFDQTKWPAHTWYPNSTGSCSTVSEYKTTTAKRCWYQSECTGTDSCAEGQCSFYDDEEQGYCVMKPKNRDTSCEVNSQNGLCDGRGNCTMYKNCSMDTDCNDSNICTNDSCVFTGQDGDGNPINGYCSNFNQIGKSCGNNMYCDVNSQCLDSSCKSGTDCNDTNTCTFEDMCRGYTEIRDGDGGLIYDIPGFCVYNNKKNYEVCELSPSYQPLKMCTTASIETASQCSLNYVTCNDPTATPQTSGNTCCGTTNIQGKFCYGSCKITPFPIYNDPATSPPNTPLFDGIGIRNAVVHITSSTCNLSFVGKTNANGVATFTIPWHVGPFDGSGDRSYYTIWADIPSSGVEFTRGTCYNGKANENPIYSVNSSLNKAACATEFNGSETVGFTSTFGFKR